MRHRILLLLSTIALQAAAAGTHVRDVRVSPSFFNPTVGRVAEVRATVDAGTVTLSVLDRDRFPIRKLPPRTVAAGESVFTWDGRDERGAVVPDEAYNIRLEWHGRGGSEVYDPSLGFHPVVEDPQPRIYSDVNGVLSYRLARPSRVHVEVGQAVMNAKTRRAEGPILRTLVDREPRVAGAVVERWNGYDESGTINISQLPHFVVSVFATSLPDNSIITCGNRRETFVQYAMQHRPANALVARKPAAGAHHTSLDALQDSAPQLRVARPNSARAGQDMNVTIGLDGPTAAHFLAQPTQLAVWVDERLVIERDRPQREAKVTLPASALTPGEHRIAVNWNSELGPAAIWAMRIAVPEVPKKAEVRQ